MDEKKSKEKGEMLFHLETDVKFLRDIATAIGTLRNECALVFHEKYMETMVVDPAHVAMMGLKVPIDSFEDYDCIENTEVGIDIDKLRALLFRAKGSVTLNNYEGDASIYGSLINEYGTYNRKMGTINTGGIPTSKVPRLDLPGKFNVKPKGVWAFVGQAETVSDYIAITASKERIQFFAESDTDEVEFIPGNLDKYQINNKCRSCFAVDYFSNMILVAKTFFDTVSIEMGTDNPIQMSGKGKVYMKMLLAPRIETEDEVIKKEKNQVDYDTLR